MTYVQRELTDYGFTTQVVLEDVVVMRFGNDRFEFKCGCLKEPRLLTDGCPLHNSGPGLSRPVEAAKRHALQFRD
jgi:hypothetical protein